MNKRIKAGLAMVAVACVAAATAIAGAGAADAGDGSRLIYKAGNAPIGTSFCLFDVCAPAGTMLHVVEGQDYGDSISLSYVRAQVTGLADICNWWIDFDFEQDPSKHVQGEFHRGCTNNAYVRTDFAMPNVFPVGRVCAVLYENAIVRSRQCHSLP